MALREDGPVFAKGKWLFPSQPPTYFLGPDNKFKVKLRHIVNGGYLAKCVSIVESPYHGEYARLSLEQPDCSQPSCKGCATEAPSVGPRQDTSVCDMDVLKDLRLDSGPLVNNIRCQACGTPKGAAAIQGVYSVWGDYIQSKNHTTAVTPEHLLLMRQRGVIDHILIDFSTPQYKARLRSKTARSLKRLADHVLDELSTPRENKRRRLKPVKSLKKLARKLGRHCLTSRYLG